MESIVVPQQQYHGTAVEPTVKSHLSEHGVDNPHRIRGLIAAHRRRPRRRQTLHLHRIQTTETATTTRTTRTTTTTTTTTKMTDGEERQRLSWGTTIKRTHGEHEKATYLPIFINNIWSYLLWPLVIPLTKRRREK